MAADNFIQKPDTQAGRIQSLAFVIAVTVCVSFSIVFVLLGLCGRRQGYEIKLDQRINPNKAAVGSLVRLPGIGFGRAAAIVAYRDNFVDKSGGRPVFHSCEDLQKVKGIGPKTKGNICPWLKFE